LHSELRYNGGEEPAFIRRAHLDECIDNVRAQSRDELSPKRICSNPEDGLTSYAARNRRIGAVKGNSAVQETSCDSYGDIGDDRSISIELLRAKVD
jgi:hypothetical protein